jgi:DNA-binding MarR family transcriptional regulator
LTHLECPVSPDSTALPYNDLVDEEQFGRFRRAFWRTFRDIDTVRLQQWESTRVTLPQLRVLYRLRRHPRSTTVELSRALGITVSTTSGLVIKLVERGLISRSTVADDRRQAPLELTEAGTALLGELGGFGRAYLDRLAAGLGEQLPAAIAGLELVADSADAVRAQDDTPKSFTTEETG